MSSSKKTPKKIVTKTPPPKWQPYIVTKPPEKAPDKPMSPRVKRSQDSAKGKP